MLSTDARITTLPLTTELEVDDRPEAVLSRIACETSSSKDPSESLLLTDCTVVREDRTVANDSRYRSKDLRTLADKTDRRGDNDDSSEEDGGLTTWRLRQTVGGGDLVSSGWGSTTAWVAQTICRFTGLPWDIMNGATPFATDSQGLNFAEGRAESVDVIIGSKKACVATRSDRIERGFSARCRSDIHSSSFDTRAAWRPLSKISSCDSRDLSSSRSDVTDLNLCSSDAYDSSSSANSAADLDMTSFTSSMSICDIVDSVE